jgi:hypothetical protein
MPSNISVFGSVGRNGANLFGDVTIVQQLLNLKIPIDSRPLDVDGLCGLATISAIERVQRHLHITQPTGKVEPDDPTFNFLTRGITADALGPYAVGVDALGIPQIAWGAKVSAAFKGKLIEIAQNIDVDPNFLISAMAFETGETFSPSIKNRNGATGLIQFLPDTAVELGTSTVDLAVMTAVDQMDYVEKYFNPYKNMLETIEDVYMAILWPAAIGKANSWVLFSKPSAQYDRNSGLDTNKDGAVTKEEAAAMVKAKLLKGRGAGYFG